MPYKASGNRVLVHKNGKWRPFHTHPTAAKAKAQAAALNIKLHKGKR